MSFTDDEIDELLVRYIDQELSSAELQFFKRILADNPEIPEKLENWNTGKRRLKALSSSTEPVRDLGILFADRIIQAAMQRVSESGDATLAPWVPRSQPAKTIESARSVQERETEPSSKNEPSRSAQRNWILGIAASGIAASLMAIAYWSSPKPALNTVLSGMGPPGITAPGFEPEKSIASLPAKIEKVTPNLDLVVLEDDRKELPNSQNSTLQSTTIASNIRSEKKVDEIKPSNLSRPSVPSINDAISSTVSPSLAPSAEQLKMLENMLANPKGTFLFVIDVSLPQDVSDLDSLRNLLDNYDIAWASQLEIDDSIQSNLAKSRMISEAGQNGLLPDFIEPKSKPDDWVKDGSSREVVSLVFVKARGKRLDAALIEVMQRTGDFPLFSFDLAFDPPTNALVDELKYIQEAKLPPSTQQESQDRSSAVRLAMPSKGTASANYFAAGPRRSKAMTIETRRQSKLPLNPEMLNPVSYALFIVRYSISENSR